jgi:streptogramin lyase
MLGAVLIGIGVLLVLFALLEPPAGMGTVEGARTLVTDVVALALLPLLVYGVIGIGATPFSGPHGVYVAGTGSVFVADTANNRVVLVYKNGVRRTVGLELNQPADVTSDGDPNGYLYIADAGNNRVVRLSGLYNFTVGDHSFNYALAAGTVGQVSMGAGLRDPQSVSVDGLGNLFIADTGNGRIVEINRLTQLQTTFLSHLDQPLAVMCDPFFTKLVYVADTGAGTVLVVLPNHKVRTLLRGLDEPAGLAEDPWGNLYVSEMGNGTILEVADHGMGAVHVLRTGLGHPRGISVDALGNLFIANTTSGQVSVISHLREHHLLTHGIPDPSAVAYAPNGAVYVVDEQQGWLQEWDGGSLRTVATGLAQPVGVAAGPDGQVWVDLHDGELVLVSPNGAVHVVKQDLAGPAQLWAVSGGSVLVAESYGGRILQVAPSGSSFDLVSGLDRPVAVARDPGGDLVVGLANGNVTEYFATPKPVLLFNLHGITAIAMDQDGNSYVASSTYATIVEHVWASGRDVVVNRDFNSISGLGASPSGTLWVVDHKSIGLFDVVSTPVWSQL